MTPVYGRLFLFLKKKDAPNTSRAPHGPSFFDRTPSIVPSDLAFHFFFQHLIILSLLQRDPVEIFRDDMMRAAKKGLFSVDVQLGGHHGTTGFFTSPDVQNYLGEKLADEGIKISFGEPMLVDGYPSLKLDWYRTRTLVKWSRVVREEVSAKYYKEHGVPVMSEETSTAAHGEETPVTLQQPHQQLKERQFSDDPRKGGLKSDTSNAVVDAIRGRREEQSAERAAQAAQAEARRKAADDALLNNSIAAVKIRAEEAK